jgi:hypothetical protein
LSELAKAGLFKDIQGLEEAAKVFAQVRKRLVFTKTGVHGLTRLFTNEIAHFEWIYGTGTTCLEKYPCTTPKVVERQ